MLSPVGDIGIENIIKEIRGIENIFKKTVLNSLLKIHLRPC